MKGNLPKSTPHGLAVAVAPAPGARLSRRRLGHHSGRAGQGPFWRLSRAACGAGLVLVAALVLACGGARDGQFSCGEGSCDLATEMCIIESADGCSACVPVPEPCAGDVTCECLLEQDHTDLGEFSCQAQGTCDEAEAEGLVLSCTPDGWGCG